MKMPWRSVADASTIATRTALPGSTATTRPVRVGDAQLRSTRSRTVAPRRLSDSAASVSTNGDGVPPWLRRAGGLSWRFLVLLAAVVVVVYGALQVQVVLIAVFLALVIASVLEPIVSWMSRVMPRPLATALSLLLSAVFFLGLLTYVIYSVSQQWTRLADQFADGLDTILDFLENGPLPVSITTTDIDRWLVEGQQWVVEHSGDIAGTIFANAGGVFVAFTIFALSIFVTVFFLARGQAMWLWFLNQLPARRRLTVHEAAGAGWFTFSGYARGTVIIAIVDGVLAYILLLIVGVPLSAPLAVLVFIGAFIPLVGAPAAMIVAAVVALAANGFWPAVIVTIGIAGIGQIEGHLLQPLIMGRQVSLHPVVVALGVTAGTFLGGLIGAVTAIPLIAVTWSVYSKLHVKDPPITEPLPSVRDITAKSEPAVT